jgi:hypothetical protein
MGKSIVTRVSDNTFCHPIRIEGSEMYYHWSENRLFLHTEILPLIQIDISPFPFFDTLV